MKKHWPNFRPRESRSPQSRPPRRRKPFGQRTAFHLEPLEERRLLAIDIVTSSTDDGSAGTLRSVIAAAAAGDTIEFQSGISEIKLTQGLSEIGANLSISGPGAAQLTIDQTDGKSGVFEVDKGSSVSMSGIAITGGTDSSFSLGSGGIVNFGSLTLTSCTITGNSSSADEAGGGILNRGSLTVTGTTISGNSGTSGVDCGGVFNSGTANISNSIFANNAGGDGMGGGFFNEGTATITGSTFSSNSCDEGGGLSSQGTTSITDCTFSGNTARLGGGIENFEGSLTVANTVISGNTANQGGGIYSDLDPGVQASVTDTVIEGNTVTGNGAADPDVFGNYATTNRDLVGIVGDATGFTDNTGAATNGNVVGTAASPATLSLAASGAGTFTATEGSKVSGTLATFTDPFSTGSPSDYSATVAWGDGTSTGQATISGPDANGTFTVAGSHTYADEHAGSLVLRVVIERGNVATVTAQDNVTVADAPLSVANTQIEAQPNAPFTGAVATFVDPGGAEPLADYSATIDWGDSSSASAGTISSPDSHGTFTISGSHTYTAAGTPTVTVTVQHDAVVPNASVQDPVKVNSGPVTPFAATLLNSTNSPEKGASIPSLSIGGTLYFVASSVGATADLWKTDGTPAGTVLIKSDVATAYGGYPSVRLYNVNGHLVVDGNQLWVSDGTASGTVAVADNSVALLFVAAQIGNTLYFASNSADETSGALWKTDGTAAGTTKIANFTGLVGDAIAYDSRLFFSIVTVGGSEYDGQLWSSDGTTGGTALVKDLGGYGSDSAGTPVPEAFPSLSVSDGKLFVATLHFFTPKYFFGPIWVSDGTASGTIVLNSSGNLGPSDFASIGTGTVFAAVDYSVRPIEAELWYTDGTPGGTKQISDLGADPGGGMNAVALDGTAGGKVIADLGFAPNTLWATDGTAAGTQLLTNVSAAISDSLGDSGAVELNGKIYFYADDGTHGGQLWVTDGSVAGTHAVTDINDSEIAGGLDPENLTVVNGLLFFSGNDGVHGSEPWVSDGTAAGTAMIDDINPGSGGSNPSNFTALGSNVFFAADDGTHGDEPWILTPQEQSLQPLQASGGQTLTATVGTLVSATTLATFTDPNGDLAADQYQSTVDWGDGAMATAGAVTGPNANGVFTVTGSHTYAEEITAGAAVSVVLHRAGAADVTVTDTVIMADAPLSGTATSVTATAQATFSGAVATFTDGNAAATAGDFTATIDWGDGTVGPGTVATASGGFQVTGSHVYAASGSEKIVVTVIDLGGQSVTITSTATVAAGGTPHERYVSAVYEDVLDRAPDAGGLAYWANLLDHGTAVSSVAEEIAHSAEYYANFLIKPDYLKLLGRAADASGIQYWTAQMQKGVTDQQLEAQFAASAEFYATAGGNDKAWVDAVYKLLLGRPIDASGETYWVGQLAQGQTRLQVAERIAGSTENNTQLINADYQHYLGRAADPQGLGFWLAQFADGKTNEDIIAGFTGSAEYYEEHTS